MIAHRSIEQRCCVNASSHTSANYYNNVDIGLLRPLTHPSCTVTTVDDDADKPEVAGRNVSCLSFYLGHRYCSVAVIFITNLPLLV
jgi:hypothetical protein